MAVIGSQGGILTATQARQRVADVSMRIGKPELDNTHGSDRSSGITTGAIFRSKTIPMPSRAHSGG